MSTLNTLKVAKPNVLRLLGDKTRRKIITLLRARELTVSKIAKELNKTPQTVYHHVRKLVDAGLVHVTRERRRGHLIESYYQTTAETFICSTEELKDAPLKEDLMEILNRLNKIGFKVLVSEEKASKLADIQARRKKLKKLHSPAPEICMKCGSTDFFFKFGPLNPVKSDYINYYADLMMMTDEEYEEKVSLERKLRRFLLSLCQEKPKT